MQQIKLLNTPQQQRSCLKNLAEYYKDDRIYHDVLRGLIFLIIAAVAIAVAAPTDLLSLCDRQNLSVEPALIGFPQP